MEVKKLMACLQSITPNGTFYLFTTRGTDRISASILQYGTYELTSDSTCTETITKHMNQPSMDGQVFKIKFETENNNTMYSQWSFGEMNFSMKEKWIRVQ